MNRVVFDNTVYEADLVCGDNGLEQGYELETAVVLSLFTNRRARSTDGVPEGNDLQGYWADAYPLVENFKWGSRLWTLARAKDLPSLPQIAKGMCEEALAWMVEDGVVEEVILTVERVRPGVLGIEVTLKKPDEIAPQFIGHWEFYYGL